MSRRNPAKMQNIRLTSLQRALRRTPSEEKAEQFARQNLKKTVLLSSPAASVVHTEPALISKLSLPLYPCRTQDVRRRRRHVGGYDQAAAAEKKDGGGRRDSRASPPSRTLAEIVEGKKNLTFSSFCILFEFCFVSSVPGVFLCLFICNIEEKGKKRTYTKK